MNNFEPKTAIFTLIVLIICLTFAAMVANAYKYVPTEGRIKNSNVVQEQIEPALESSVTDDSNISEDEEEDVQAEEVEEEDAVENSDDWFDDVSPKAAFELNQPFEEITEEELPNLQG
jgi:hypothetical protein